ncbi:MAG: FAD/NAD(P)-binding protein [Zetaproteobacteria bacterium]|nr:FAD/NAD(P)-binding protein [Zetaproteobacteria bacterium]
MVEGAAVEVYDWLIVGGGIHGTHIAVRLLASSRTQPVAVRIVDPSVTLLRKWRERSASTKMKYLRSPGVHNLATDPFALKTFAGKKSRTKPGIFAQPYARPALELFNRHCDALIADASLGELHIMDTIQSMDLGEDRVQLKTTSGKLLQSKKVVLALGPAEIKKTPSWVTPEMSQVQHLFAAEFDWSEIVKYKSVAIIGGGISAVQAALYAESIGLEVHLLSRHPMRTHMFDSDPGWLGPKFLTQFSREKSYAKRRQWIDRSRYTGSVPPEIHRSLNSRIQSGRIHFRQTEVDCGQQEGVTTQLTLKDRHQIEVDQVILATGFQKARPGGKMIDRLVERYQLPVSVCGFPIVDRQLRWHPRIYVSGSLAELEIGPVAKNIAGARQAAERIESALKN